MKTVISLYLLLLLPSMLSAQCVPGQVTQVISLGSGYYELVFEIQEPTNYIMIDHWFGFPGVGGTGGNVAQFETEGWQPYHLLIYWADPADPTTTVCTSGLSDDIYIPCYMVEAEWSPGVLSEDGTGALFNIVATGGNGDFTFSYQANADYVVMANNMVYVPFTEEPYAFLEFQATDTEGCQSSWRGMALENPNLQCHLTADWYVENQILYGQFEVMIGQNPISYPVVEWDFGDGSQDLCYECTQNVWIPLHTYSAEGDYQVCVISLDDFEDSCPDTVCQSISVGPLSTVCPTVVNPIPEYVGSDGYMMDIAWSEELAVEPLFTVSAVDDVFPSPYFLGFDTAGFHEICLTIDWSSIGDASLLQCPADTCMSVMFDCPYFFPVIASADWNMEGTQMTFWPYCTSTNGGCSYAWNTNNDYVENANGSITIQAFSNGIIEGYVLAMDAMQCISDTTSFFYEVPVPDCNFVVNYAQYGDTVVVYFDLNANNSIVPDAPVVCDWGNGATTSNNLQGLWSSSLWYIYPEPGQYTLCVTTDETQFDMCEAYYCFNVNIEGSGVNVNEIISAPWMVYPNPSSGLLQAHASVGDRIQILDAQGRLLHQEYVQTTGLWSAEMDLPGGIYFVQRAQLNGVQTCRWVVHKE